MRTGDPIDIIIGGRVRARRTILGMSQEKLGELVGLTFQQIQKYEGGKNRVSGSMLVHIARALDCKVEYFFDGIEQGAPAASEIPLSVEAIKLARRFDAVRDPYVKEIMVRTLGAFERSPAREAADVLTYEVQMKMIPAPSERPPPKGLEYLADWHTFMPPFSDMYLAIGAAENAKALWNGRASYADNHRKALAEIVATIGELMVAMGAKIEVRIAKITTTRKIEIVEEAEQLFEKQKHS